MAGWSRITGMSWEERGIATAMSLGGRAQRVAMQIPQHVLGTRQGLSILLARLEADIGSEIQDRVRAAGKNFERYRRPKGQNAADFVIMFEQLYAEALGHGLMMNRTLLSQKLIDAASLSEHQETAVLQQVHGDYSRHEDIRRAIRRLPGLDSRHSSDAQLYYGSEGNPNQVNSQSSYNPSGSTLQRPPPEVPSETFPAYPTIAEEEAFEESEDWVTVNSDEDDYLSIRSDEPEEEAELLAQAWVIQVNMLILTRI